MYALSQSCGTYTDRYVDEACCFRSILGSCLSLCPLAMSLVYCEYGRVGMEALIIYLSIYIFLILSLCVYRNIAQSVLGNTSAVLSAFKEEGYSVPLSMRNVLFGGKLPSFLGQVWCCRVPKAIICTCLTRLQYRRCFYD